MNAREILEQLRELTTEGRKGVSVLYEVEEELAHAEHHLDTVEALAFLEAEGSVAERNVRARLAAAEARLNRDLAKAKVNRVRTKLKLIESEMMASATMSKLLQAEMRLEGGA
jgi:hypothetical protein